MTLIVPRSLKDNWKDLNLSSRSKNFRKVNTGKIKTFRLAVSTTGGYTSFWGDDDPSNGTNKEDAYAAVVSTINRVNEVFETELGIHLELVSGLDLIYPNVDSDPYTSDLNTQAQETLDEILGRELRYRSSVCICQRWRKRQCRQCGKCLSKWD